MAKFIRVENLWFDPAKVKTVHILTGTIADGTVVFSVYVDTHIVKRFMTGKKTTKAQREELKQKAMTYAEQLVQKIEEAE